MAPVRPSDPRFPVRAGFVTWLFWMNVWNLTLADLTGGRDAR